MKINKEIFNLPAEDILDIPNLIRVDGLVKFPEKDKNGFLKMSKIQTYIIGGTIYGCFAYKENDKIKVTWMGYHKNLENIIIPDSRLNLNEIMTRCEPSAIEHILYHLDIL